MVEQAAERRAAQSGFNAFSFFAGVLQCFREFAVDGCDTSLFGGGGRGSFDPDGARRGFFRCSAAFSSLRHKRIRHRLLGSGVVVDSMACVGVMRPRSGKSVRCAAAGAPGAYDARVASPVRSVDRWVDTVRLVVDLLWAAAVH